MGTFDNTRRGNAHKAKTFADTIPRMSSIKRFGCEIAHKQSVKVNGLRLNFLEWGMSGRPVLCFLHGGSAHAHWFDLVAPAFVDRFHVIALDQRGHGESQWAAPPAYATENFSADLLGVIDAPTLIARGELSPVLPRVMAEKLCAAIRGATLAEILASYHHLVLDNPAGFVRALEKFLAASKPTR